MSRKDELLAELEEGSIELNEAAGKDSIEEVLQKVDLLIEKLFVAKAELRCFFDRQFFVSGSKPECNGNTNELKTPQARVKLRQICLHFLRTIKTLSQKEGYLIYILPRIFTVLRLEISLRNVEPIGDEPNKGVESSFPLPLVEYIIGLALYSADYDDGIVEILIHDYIVSSDEWLYNAYSALENMLKDFDAPQFDLYRNDNLSAEIFFARFVSFLLALPAPQFPSHLKVTSAPNSEKTSEHTNSNDENDSDSDIDYGSVSSEEDDADVSISSESMESHVSATVEGFHWPFNFTKTYGALWQSVIFAKLPMPKELLAEIMSRMPTSILPYTKTPMIYTNWLMGQLHGEDKVLSMLSLGSIFELILKYGLAELDCIRANENRQCSISAFYELLYGHISSFVLNSKFGNQFLYFLNMALKSTMMPSSMTMKFIKKIVRMSCFTNSMKSAALLTIAFNLLKRHAQTYLNIVHRDTIRDAKQTRDVSDMEILTDVVESNDNEKDTTFLWELPLLMNHFNERSAVIASTFYSDLKRKRSLLLKAEDVILSDSRDHLRQELMRTCREDTNTFRKKLQRKTKLLSKFFE
ncbi:CBF Mak21 family protein [Babesia ovata]|uniref:CBF Mak21 family protein n=1 Tax=Babesia ovata TaxID=189622 RepID=A0A2H6KCB8_9APIC|nr:CBF Mak21 family protein [Babesia ovata]GBE60624.1 CBF Mak21 family protein [Babesia ovata]